MNKRMITMYLACTILVLGSLATADVFNMGSGLTSLETVTVGNPGNAPDTRYETPGYGAVGYKYNIGKYEVTNAQYCEFLNAVATADINGLYDSNMGGGWSDIGGISQSGSPDNYSYSVRLNRGNRPVNYVNFYDTLRFANWLHNDQPTGAQDDTTTEDGAYDMSLGSNVERKAGALVWLPSEDEWYKAAYYKGGGTNSGYWNYTTQSDDPPTAELPLGTDPNGSANYLDVGYLDTINYTTEVGAYTFKPSESAYGTFDQNGNLVEWIDEVISGSDLRVNRGGSWGTIVTDLHASHRPTSMPDGSERPAVGFRVAEVPEPGTLSLLAIGGLAMLRRKK